MPVSMVQQNILIRISFLKDEMTALMASRLEAEESYEYNRISGEISDKESCIKENERWLRVLDRDPGFGSLMNVAGKYIPKMPTFESKEEVEYALENPDHIHKEDDDTGEQEFLGAREHVHRWHNEQALIRMDGKGPIAHEEQCGHQNEES